jgi:spermidine synthase
VALILALFSGFSALLYQILWAREFSLVLGSTTYAISTVLAAFMAGLGAGSLIWGPIVDRSGRHPLQLYAAMELAIAASALLLELALHVFDGFYGVLYNLPLPSSLFYAARFAVTFVVIGIPTFFMGGTLPALIGERTGAGRVYAANTIGAALGAFAAGWVLIERLGLSGTLSLAVAVNVGVALLAWAIARRSVPLLASVPPEPAGRGAIDSGLIVYSLSGFVALGLEVLWSRTLVFAIGSTTYAFSAVLVVVLLGLALGSAAGSRFIRTRHLRWLAIGQWLLAVLTLSASWVFAHLSLPLQDWLAYTDTLPWSRRVWIQFAQTAVLLLPSAILFGAVFPLAANAYLGRSRVAVRVGRLLAANTFAAIAGALSTGFVFIPLLGIHYSYVVLGLLSLAAAVIAAMWRQEALSRRTVVLAAAACMALPVLFSARTPLEPSRPTDRLLFYKEGLSGTISVVEDPAGERNLMIDHIAVAGTDPIFMTDQKSLAHLPMLLHPNPRTVLTIGFGSGGASYSFTTYPQLQSIRAVEIDPAVLEAAPYFKQRNGDPFADPRFAVIRDDARSFLLHTRDTYDIITTDCTDLRYKSNALLYTREFFESARRRLNPGGLVVAWVPLGGLSTADLKTTLRTFAVSFPQAYAWYMYNYPTHYLLVVGAAEGLNFSNDKIRERLAVPSVRRDLAEIGLDDAIKIVSGLFKDRELLLAFTEGAPINSDDKPVLEFSVPRSPHAYTLTTNLEQFTRDVVALPEVPKAVLRARERIVAGHAEYNKPGSHYQAALRSYGSARQLNPEDAWLPKLMSATQATAVARRNELEASALSTPDDYQVFNEVGLIREDFGDLDGALSAFQRAVKLRPREPALHLNIGRVYDLKGLSKESLDAYGAALLLNPVYAEAWNNKGVAHLGRQENDKAFAAFEKAVEFAPDHSTYWMNLGLAAFRSERPQRAREAFDGALQLDPKEADAYLNRAILRLSAGDLSAARADLQSAIGLRPEHGEAHYNLGIVEEQLRNVSAAAAEYVRAIELKPDHAPAYNNLGIIYSDRGDSQLAIDTYLKGIAVDPRNPGLRNNLAMEYVKLGSLNEAIAQYQEAIALQPAMFEPYANLGMIYRRKNQPAEAARYLAEARKRNPSFRIP